MFDLLNSSSVSYRNRSYTLVEDTLHREVNIEEDQEDHKEDQVNIEEDEVDYKEGHEEKSVTIEEVDETSDENSTLVLSAEKTAVEEMVSPDNLDSSIIIGCSAVGVVSLVILILLVIYCTHSSSKPRDPDLKVRQRNREMLQSYPTVTGNFQVNTLLILLFRN